MFNYDLNLRQFVGDLFVENVFYGNGTNDFAGFGFLQVGCRFLSHR